MLAEVRYCGYPTSRDGRPELATVLQFIRAGDELVVPRLDRLGRDSQMERRFIKERQREGIERAKAEGRYVGGKRRIDRSAVLARKAAGESVAMIATGLGCSRMQIYRVLAGGA